MPAFTFEKISSSVRRLPITPSSNKQRGVIGRMIDRLVEIRTKPGSRAERSVRRDQKPE